MWDGINRRQFPRISFKCLICIKKQDSTKTISTHTENIGAGGICVILNEDIGLFQGVSIDITLKDEALRNIKCSGTVVWVIKKHDASPKGPMQYDTGIEFVDISEGDKDRITKVVDGQLKK